MQRISLSQVKDFGLITLGSLMVAFGVCAFVLPENVVIGGVTGLGSIAYFLTGFPYAIGVVQYAINIILLALAWRIVGKGFVFHTIYGATMLSVFITFLPAILPHEVVGTGYQLLPLVPGEPFMCIIIGAIISGLGMGIIFTSGGSTGGTDIVAAMVATKSNASIGRTMLYVDFCIISSSFLIFHKLPSVVYGFVFLFISTYVIDLVINSNRQTIQLTIFSPQWQPIAKAINSYARRGVTVIEAIGWYSQKPTKVLLVYARKSEAITIYRIIKSIDADAFVAQARVSAVYGTGFDHIKLKDDEKLTAEVGKLIHTTDEAVVNGVKG